MTVSHAVLRKGEEVLKVLRILQSSPELTQRELSLILGISLGKINFILRALIDQGLIKSQNFISSRNKKAYSYTLTLSGIEEKARITCIFLAQKMEEYKELKKQIRVLKKEVSEYDFSK